MGQYLLLAVVLAILSFSFKSVGYALQKKGVDRIRASRAGTHQRIRDYLTNATWLIGQLFPFVGMALLIGAYAFGPISTLMPLMGIGLIVLALFCRFYLKEAIRPLEWLAIGFTVIGLVLINFPSMRPGGTPILDLPSMAADLQRPGSLLFLLLPNLIITVLLVRSALRSWRHSGSLFGVGAGIVGGTALIFQKPMSVGLRILFGDGPMDHLGAVLLSTFLMILLSLLAIAFANIGYNHGRGVLVAPLYSVFQMLFPTVGGMIIYGEWTGIHAVSITVRAAGIAVILLSMTVLSLTNELKLSPARNPDAERPMVSLIAAVAENNVIGRGNSMIWRIPEDLAHFREITMGHHVVMGRKTFETLTGPLEGRTLIVLTRKKNLRIRRPWQGKDDTVPLVVHSPEEAVRSARERGDTELFVAGGGEIYRHFWDQAQRIYLTRVHASFEGDIFFPSLGPEWVEEQREDRGEAHPFPISYVLYRRLRDERMT
jgi:dihydrofolate reductase